MKPMKAFDDLETRRKITRSKLRLGTFYGIGAGTAFALSAWGWDGYLLSTLHGYLPWIKLITGIVLCGGFGGVMGWLAARSESSLVGVLIWVLATAFFAWMITLIPLRINPFMISLIDPQWGQLLHYGQDAGAAARFGVAFAWIIPFTFLVGIAQLPMVEPASFSATFFGKLLPIIYCATVMGIGGIATDNMINSHLRTAIFALDHTVQFVSDNKGNENVDKALSRKMHAAALRNVEDLVVESRLLFVSNYSESMEDIKVLIRFEDHWVECGVIYGNPGNCKEVGNQ